MKAPGGAARSRRETAFWIGALVLLPLLGYGACRQLSALPRSVRIATGPRDGRYREISRELARELEARLPIQVEVVESEGSLEHLEMLRDGTADLAIYQQGAAELLDIVPPEDLRFLARLYSEPVQILVSEASGIRRATELAGRRVDLGRKSAGDYATSVLLLDHLGIGEEDVEACNIDYVQAREALASGELDAAIVTVGVRARMFPKLMDAVDVHVLPVPWRDALLLRAPYLSPYRIPAGSYGDPPHVEPVEDVETVATAAQLVSTADLPSAIAEELASIVHDQGFQRKLGLGELFTEGAAFSLDRPDFPVHDGVQTYHDPRLRPWIDPQFAEATENLRSLVFSTLIAGFLVWRWGRKVRDRTREHRLDRFVRALLEIERQQAELDRGREGTDLRAETERLQELLEEVTRLRQEALGAFTAHELNEDRGPDTFVEMCHALSNKINAKITRLRFEQVMESR